MDYDQVDMFDEYKKALQPITLSMSIQKKHLSLRIAFVYDTPTTMANAEVRYEVFRRLTNKWCDMTPYLKQVAMTLQFTTLRDDKSNQERNCLSDMPTLLLALSDIFKVLNDHAMIFERNLIVSSILTDNVKALIDYYYNVNKNPS